MSTDRIGDTIAAARAKSERQDRAFAEEMRRSKEEHDSRRQRWEREVLPYVRPAGRSEYEMWMRDFIGQGGKPTHVYDYPFERVRDIFWRASGSFSLLALHGSQSVCVLVPGGIVVETPEGLGHNTLYLVGGRLEGSWVPIYSDMF